MLKASKNRLFSLENKTYFSNGFRVAEKPWKACKVDSVRISFQRCLPTQSAGILGPFSTMSEVGPTWKHHEKKAVEAFELAISHIFCMNQVVFAFNIHKMQAANKV